jgi:hypothetical protein
MLTRAQEVKRKWQQNPPKGNNNFTCPLISESDLLCAASILKIVGKDGNPVSEKIVEKVVTIEKIGISVIRKIRKSLRSRLTPRG